ncbi:hypothetical protein GCM10009608_52900 [Pseudonocardia alaniniphila]
MIANRERGTAPHTAPRPTTVINLRKAHRKPPSPAMITSPGPAAGPHTAPRPEMTINTRGGRPAPVRGPPAIADRATRDPQEGPGPGGFGFVAPDARGRRRPADRRPARALPEGVG